MIMPTIKELMAKINGSIRHRQVVLNQMGMGCTTWRAMSGYGVKIGVIVVKIKKCCWVVLGSIIPSTYGWLILPPTIRILRLIAMVCVSGSP